MIIRKTAAALSLSLACGLASRAGAATPVPNTFTAGTPAKAAEVNANFQFVMDQIAAAMPTGTVLPFAGGAAPSGFLLCDGAAVSRTQYAALFAVIGTAYGAGDGTTTFNLPDLRGVFIRGLDVGRGVDAGRALGTEQLDALQGHVHSLGVGSGDDSANVVGTRYPDFIGGLSGTVRQTSPPASDGINGTPRVAAETRPRNVALNFIIRA